MLSDEDKEFITGTVQGSLERSTQMIIQNLPKLTGFGDPKVAEKKDWKTYATVGAVVVGSFAVGYGVRHLIGRKAPASYTSMDRMIDKTMPPSTEGMLPMPARPVAPPMRS